MRLLPELFTLILVLQVLQLILSLLMLLLIAPDQTLDGYFKRTITRVVTIRMQWKLLVIVAMSLIILNEHVKNCKTRN